MPMIIVLGISIQAVDEVNLAISEHIEIMTESDP